MLIKLPNDSGNELVRHLNRQLIQRECYYPHTHTHRTYLAKYCFVGICKGAVLVMFWSRIKLNFSLLYQLLWHGTIMIIFYKPSSSSPGSALGRNFVKIFIAYILTRCHPMAKIQFTISIRRIFFSFFIKVSHKTRR